ncbi:MAG TPA: DUF4142 domain-containing protein [Flavisolibacter sp.]|nr:DUF4142 domain-containing protein [Flavisolibacter sp.]
MKKNLLAIACFSVAVAFTACSDSATSTSDAGDSTNASTNSTATESGDANNTTGSTTATTKTPLSAQDSTFVMKAAMGGMMEVESGNVAQQNGNHDRVKSFATMMVNDHSKANSELMALVSGRGITLPTALPQDMQSHMEEMKKMKGAAFDKHYMGMMVNDHQKTITDFQSQANNGSDPELKAWAAKTLPVLQMHADSAKAINSAIK